MILSDEEVDERQDRGIWLQQDCDIAWVKGFIEAQWSWERAVGEVAEEELKEAPMGGKRGKVKISWPVALLLATRN